MSLLRPVSRFFNRSVLRTSLPATSRFHFSSTRARFSTTTKATKPDGPGPLTELVRDFLDPAVFIGQLEAKGHDFFSGVPDSLLKDFCAFLSDNVPASRHVMAANEGNAVAIAAGYHLATGKVPVVYMQNSGFGNAVNPILSLADRKVYDVPMLLLIGWRGEPGRKDEPQHVVQGKVMTALLADMNIPFEILPDYEDGAADALEQAAGHFARRGGPYAMLVRKRTFESYKLKTPATNPHPLKREDVLRLIIENSGDWDAFVSTTGFASREMFEIRESLGHDHSREFLTVGSMGHSASIALGIAIAKPSRQVICIDGDGALLMHMGTLHTAGMSKATNFKHVLVNNGAHDSVGAQETGALTTDFCTMALACGYTSAESAESADDIAAAYQRLRQAKGPAFLEIRCKPGARSDLGRPTSSPKQNKQGFMEFLEQ